MQNVNSSNLTLLILTGVVSIIISLTSINAQEIEVTSSEAIVTASRIPQENYKTGRSVDIISHADILEYPVQSVDELLRYVTGVQTNMRAPFGVQNDIGMRGSTFSQVLVLIDNVRFNDPLTAHFNNNIPVSIAEIDHIEVIKGPAAAIYGSDAVGGLIHIKTKVYVEHEESRKLESVVDMSLGQNNLLMSDAALIMKKSKWLISGSMMNRISDGEQLVNPNFESGTSSDSLYSTDFDLRTYSAALGYQFNENTKLLLRAGYDFRDFNAKYFYTQSSFDESRETTTNEWGMAALTYRLNKHDVEVNFGYKSADDLFVFNPLFSPNDHNTQQYIGQYNHNFKWSNKTTLGFGAQYVRKTIVSTDRGDHENAGIGIYITGSHAITDRLFANAGLRLENDANFGNELLPQFSLSWKKDILVLRTSYGKSIRAADFTERYVSAQIATLTAGRNVGNPDLKAERSHSFDLGADVYLENGIKVSATGFHRQSSNLIDFSLRNESSIDNLTNLVAGADYFYADNITESSVTGLELTASQKWELWERGYFKANLGYTYLSTDAEAGNLSKYISNHPTLQFNSILAFKVYKINIHLASLYAKRNSELVEGIGEIPESYFTHNFKFAYNTLPNVQLYFEAFNLTDVEYQEIIGAAIPGRWWRFGISYTVDNTQF